LTVGTVHVPVSRRSCSEDPSDEETLLVTVVVLADIVVATLALKTTSVVQFFQHGS